VVNMYLSTSRICNTTFADSEMIVLLGRGMWV
jgi:hypothetical protein